MYMYVISKEGRKHLRSSEAYVFIHVHALRLAKDKPQKDDNNTVAPVQTCERQTYLQVIGQWRGTHQLSEGELVYCVVLRHDEIAREKLC